MFYFDNASTTKISEKALETYVNASEKFFNPSSLYLEAVKVKQEIEKARKFFLTYLKAKSEGTFIFTGCATEANNSVLNSCITRKDKKYLIGAGEHSSIYVFAKKLIESGYNIEFIPLKSNGGVDVDVLKDMLDENVAFVSVIHVSNETGAINNIAEISKILKSYNKNIILHSDGVQAVGKVEINLKNMGVDFYTISAHKINGPKGIGGLYIASPNKFKSFILGGGQEFDYRAGTENTPAILSFKTALENVSFHDFSAYKQAILSQIQEEHILVSDENCVPNIISICFKDVRGETVEHMLENKGYLIGTGSACNSKLGYNRVLETIIKDRRYLSGAVRVSFDDSVTIEDAKNLGREINLAVKELKSKTKRGRSI